jgi:uracil phosphoribosyltransferase
MIIFDSGKISMEKKMGLVKLKAADLDGLLNEKDIQNLERLNRQMDEANSVFGSYSDNHNDKRLIEIYNRIGDDLRSIIEKEKNIHVYSFETPPEIHGEVSRLISKLRDVKTSQSEFIYYIQRAYELLFNLAFTGKNRKDKNYIFVKTPVNVPVQNYAVHKIPCVDDLIGESVMCVMLRGALLPSMILSKEIQEYSSDNYVTPFALFKISRDDKKEERNMEYILDLTKSYFSFEELSGKDLFFADPMNATGGSLVTIIRYLKDNNVIPRSIKFFNVISSLKGALRIHRALDNIEIYTLWMDPALNKLAYILPGLGDAGDRINGMDREGSPRNIIQLIADYGISISSLYRDQVVRIEKTVLG